MATKKIADPKKLLLKVAQMWEKFPQKWTRRAFARDASRRDVATTSRKAVCFCAVGALDRFGDPSAVNDARRALHKATPAGLYLTEWNDGLGPRGAAKAARTFRQAAGAL
jgi:hypothetical protein